MFRASLCPSSGEYVTSCVVLRWFCWMWLVAVVGRCLVGCEHCEGRTVTFTVLTPYKAAPHKRYQPHPAEAAQHNTCSNTRLVLLKMGIMMPETCSEIVKNKHLTVASCWFSLSLHNLLTMHGHRNLKFLTVSIVNLLVPSRHATQPYKFTLNAQSPMVTVHTAHC